VSKNRQKLQTWWWRCLLVALVWLAFLVGSPGQGNAGSGGYRGSPVIFLSDDFWQSMEKYANANSDSEKVYGDRQQFLLEKIDKGQRFVVKTNLTLIKQNEKIIRLLEDLKRQSRGDSN
jgi:hypothetical protein